MNPLHLLLIENFTKLTNLFLNLIKFGAGIGGLSLIYYLLLISYLPNEFAIGDGLLLFMLSIVIGMICCVIFLLLWIQGKLIFDVFFLIYKKSPKIVKNIISRKVAGDIKLIIPKFDKFTSFLICLISFFIFLVVSFSLESAEFLYYIIVCIYLYIFYILIYNICLEYKYLSKILNNNSSIENAYEKILKNKLRERKNALSILMGAFLIIPFLMGGQYNVIEKIVNFSMEKTNVRVMKTSIYIKNDFAQLILMKSMGGNKINYTRINNVDILFRGGGKNTLIGFLKNGVYIKMEVPNDSLLNVYHVKN